VTVLHALVAVVRRNLAIATRRKDLIVQTVAVPIVVLTLASIIFAGGDAWPVAVVDKDGSPESARFLDALHDTEGALGPYYTVVETDEESAVEQVAAGRLHLVVEIPADFGATGTVEVTTYNINTDTMKNVRLRLTTTANLYDEGSGADQVRATIAKARAEDVPRAAFMGGSAVILALLLGSTLIAANIFAMEEEIRTTKELVLTPLGAPIGAMGAALSGALLAFAAAIPTAVVAVLFGFRPDPAGLAGALPIVAPSMLAAGGLGVIVAQLMRSHRAIQPVVIMAAIGSYFAAGGFIPVGGLPPAARQVASVWPPSYVFEWSNPIVHGFDGGTSWSAVAVLAVAMAAGLALAWWAGLRETRRPVRSGQ
jgi:ABC-type multidrug transport system permease subunit